MLSTLLGKPRHWARVAAGGNRFFWIFLTLGLLGLRADALAHAVAQGDKGRWYCWLPL